VRAFLLLEVGMSFFDLEVLNESAEFIVGSDEVGRGPLAGSVVACSVGVNRGELAQFVEQIRALGVTDSKKLTQKKREIILTKLGIDYRNLKFKTKYSVGPALFCLCEVGPAEIDKINILKSSLLAMDRSRLELNGGACELWLVDGNRAPRPSNERLEVKCIVKGDQKSALIGLASVIAKTYRDFLMQELAKVYPGYGLDKHAGYPTQSHRDAIATLGPSPIHRMSFKGVREYVEISSGSTK